MKKMHIFRKWMRKTVKRIRHQEHLSNTGLICIIGLLMFTVSFIGNRSDSLAPLLRSSILDSVPKRESYTTYEQKQTIVLNGIEYFLVPTNSQKIHP